MKRIFLLFALLLTLTTVGMGQGSGSLTVTDNVRTCYNCRKIIFGSITVSGNTATVAGGGGSGDVVGPASATDNAVVRFDSTTGKLVQSSVVTIGDTGDVAGIVNLIFTGILTGGSAPTTITDSTGKILSAALNDVQFANFVAAPSAGFVGATGAGDYSHRTPTQVTAALDAFVGDSGSGGTKGLVPAPSTGDAGKYLKGDGTWATVSGGGITVGTTTITSGTNTRLPYNNAGVYGEISGFTSDGTNVTAGSGNLRATLPQITTGIRDANGNLMLGFSPTASATESITITNNTATNAVGFTVTTSAAAASTQAGNGFNITAAPAIAGTTNAGAAAGGSVTITAGNAARLTSGNANGGSIVLVGGAGIGTGTQGLVAIGGTTSSFPAFNFFSNSFSVASIGLRKANDTSDNGSMHMGAFGLTQNTSSDTANGIAFVAASNSINIGSGGVIRFASIASGTLSAMNGGDAGFARSAAQTIRVTNGSTGAGTFSVAAVTPSQITADQNNYAPGVGWFQRWSSDASRNVTGLSAGQDGQVIEIYNVGSNNIVLVNESASSTAANRFANSTGADLTLTASKCAEGRYDSTSARWRMRLCN